MCKERRYETIYEDFYTAYRAVAGGGGRLRAR